MVRSKRGLLVIVGNYYVIATSDVEAMLWSTLSEIGLLHVATYWLCYFIYLFLFILCVCICASYDGVI